MWVLKAVLMALILAPIGLGCDGDGENPGPSTDPVPTGGEPDTAPLPETNDDDDESGFIQEGSLRTELTRQRDRAFLDVDGILTRKNIRDFTGYIGTISFDPVMLEGQLPSETYNSIRFPSEDGLGVAAQLWLHETADEAGVMYEELLKSFILPTDIELDGYDAFTSDFGGIRQVVVDLSHESQILVLACQAEVCTAPAALIDLATAVVRQTLGESVQ